MKVSTAGATSRLWSGSQVLGIRAGCGMCVSAMPHLDFILMSCLQFRDTISNLHWLKGSMASAMPASCGVVPGAQWVGKSTKASADLSCFKSMWLILHACWPEALWHWLNPGGARAVNWLAEGQLRGADICGMADFKEAAKGLSLGPGLLEAWKGSGSLHALVWPGFVELRAVHWGRLHPCSALLSTDEDCLWIHRWGLNWETLETANELRRREYRELNTWSFTSPRQCFWNTFDSWGLEQTGDWHLTSKGCKDGSDVCNNTCDFVSQQSSLCQGWAVSPLPFAVSESPEVSLSLLSGNYRGIPLLSPLA